VLYFAVEIEAVGQVGSVSRDDHVAGALEARSLGRSATAAADEFNLPRQEHLERLTATLQQEEIDLQTVAFEGADFLGYIERRNATADARQSKKERLLGLGRKRRRT